MDIKERNDARVARVRGRQLRVAGLARGGERGGGGERRMKADRAAEYNGGANEWSRTTAIEF